MRAGLLDRVILIQTPVETPGTAGGAVTTWEDFATVRAQKIDLRGSERFAAQQVNARITTKFIIRWRSDITSKMRIVYDGKNYDMQPPVEIGRRVGLEIMAAGVEVD